MVADVPEASVGAVIEKIGQRKGDLVSMTPVGSRYAVWNSWFPPGACSAIGTNF